MAVKILTIHLWYKACIMLMFANALQWSQQYDLYSKWKVHDYTETAGVATFNANQDMW